MIRFTLISAAVATALLSATAAQAAPARSFECPATLREALSLATGLVDIGKDQRPGNYPPEVYFYSPAGYTVFGLTPTRLWTKALNGGEGFMFMAEVPVSFDAAKAAMLRGKGVSACAITEPYHCKFYTPASGVPHNVLQYVERLSDGRIQIGCEYSKG